MVSPVRIRVPPLEKVLQNAGFSLYESLGVEAAPQQHHYVQPVDLSFLGGRIGPPGPGQFPGKRLLDDAVVQTEVTLPAVPLLGPSDQESHERPGGEGHKPQKSRLS